MERCGPMADLFLLKFRALILERRAAPREDKHLSERSDAG
jgi:hypothetical protein